METIIDHNIDPSNGLPILAEVSPWDTVKKYALFKIFASIVISLLMVIMNNFSWVAGLVGISITILLLVFAFREHKKDYLNGYLPFARVVRLSWLMGLVMTLPMVIFTYVLYQYIAPNALDLLLEGVRTKMEAQFAKNPNADPEVVETILYYYKKFLFNPISMSVMALCNTAISELIVGMIVGLFVRKEIPKIAL